MCVLSPFPHLYDLSFFTSPPLHFSLKFSPAYFPPPYLFLSSLFTCASPVSMVEEGVVIIALVILHSYIARQYTLRAVSGAVKHTHNELSLVHASLFTLFLSSTV